MGSQLNGTLDESEIGDLQYFRDCLAPAVRKNLKMDLPDVSNFISRMKLYFTDMFSNRRDLAAELDLVGFYILAHNIDRLCGNNDNFLSTGEIISFYEGLGLPIPPPKQ